MAVVLMEGFDLSRTPVGTGVPTAATTAGEFSGGQLGGLGVAPRSTSGTGVRGIHWPLGASMSSGCVGARIICGSLGTFIGQPFFALQEGANAITHLNLRFNASGQIELYLGNVTLLATSTLTFNQSQWNYYEIEFVIGDGTSGSATVYVNGVSVISVTGVDTRNAGTGVVNAFSLTASASNTGSGFAVIDDFYATDTTGPAPNNGRLGEVFVETKYPTGNGATNQWVGSDGNSTDNYLLVDDQASADYVGSGTVGHRDLYAMTTGSASLGAVIATQVELIAAKSDAGTPPGPLLLVERSQGGTVVTTNLWAAASMTTGYATFVAPIRNLDPNGDAWTLARLNAAQFGVEVG